MRFIGDPDNDGILGTSPLNTNTAGVIDDRGRVIEHKDAGGYEIEPKKDSNGNYLFQTPGVVSKLNPTTINKWL